MRTGIQVVAGVDTHADTHYAAIITTTGEHLGAAQFPTTPAGYAALTGFITCHGPLARVGVEGTNSYGAGLARHLRAQGIAVEEVIRPARQVRRLKGKSDPIDAYQAAHTALTHENVVTAKTADGTVEAIRVLHAGRRSAVKARCGVMTQLKSLLVTAPDRVRDAWREVGKRELIDGLAALRARSGDTVVEAATRATLKRLAVRYRQLSEEIMADDTDLDQLVQATNPGLLAAHGISTITAAQLLITAGDNPDRLHTEGAFATLCGVAPIPASSGKTTRWRLSRGGDRGANNALYTIVLSRMANDRRTRAYVTRRTREGKTTRDIIRCLKRAVARQVFHLLTHPQPAIAVTGLRTARKRLEAPQV